MFKIFILIIIFIALWLFVWQALDIVDEFAHYSYRNNKNKLFNRIMNIFFFPYLIPFTFSLTIVMLDRINPLVKFKENALTSTEKFTSLFLTGLAINFVICLFVIFSGGSWQYSTKSGNRDLRYKYNQYSENHDEISRGVAKQFLLIPFCLLLFYIGKYLISNFLIKK